MENKLVKLPTLDQLVQQSESDTKDNALMVLLNQPPPASWLKTTKFNPNPYLPIDKVEYLFHKIYGGYSVAVKSVQTIANSVVVTLTITVKNPITGELESQDGVGASPIQTDSGAGAMDWNKAKAQGVQMAAPAAKAYAIKDAAEQFGRIFGRDIARKETIDYTGLLKEQPKTMPLEDLQYLFDMKREALNPQELANAIRIIEGKEVANYNKLHNLLMGK